MQNNTIALHLIVSENKFTFKSNWCGMFVKIDCNFATCIMMLNKTWTKVYQGGERYIITVEK